MRDLNRHQCIGRLGSDPECKYTANGTAVTTLSIACCEQWKDKQTGQKQDKTEWIRYILFNRLAEIAGEYLRKGSKVYIEGKLQTRKWQDQSGQDRYSTEIIAGELQMLDSNAGDNSNQKQQSRPPANNSANSVGMHNEGIMDSFDDDIPFR